MTRKLWIFIVISVLVLAGLACTLGKTAGTSPTQAPAAGAELTQALQPAQGQNDPTSVESASSTPVPTPTPLPTPTSIPSSPIGLWTGLSSLNSYRLTIRVVANGPTAQDKNQNTTLIESGSDGKSSHTHIESISSSAEYPETETSTSDQYQVDKRTCDFSSGSDEVTISAADSMAQEMMGTWATMVDLVPMVKDPVFIAAEELNGVKTNHFSFNVSGLGVDSGAEVVASSGEYWLAQDGQYIVKYSVVLETRDGPAGDANTQTMHAEFVIELKDINQDIVITLPDVCQ